MLELTRTVRFSVNQPPPGPPPGASSGWGEGNNTFAAYPTMLGLGRHYELDIRCGGEVDAATGYFINIKEIDQAARRSIIPAIERACLEKPWSEPAEVLAETAPLLEAALGSGRLRGVRWRLSPYYSIEVRMAARDVALLRQQFEFAASHRLHVAGVSEQQNREMFGKCNNPSGHGHNYRVEPAVEVPVGGPGPAFTLVDLERITHETLIKRFDHMHLNVDTPEFTPGKGLNPSVENIAKVCYDLLEPAIRRERSDVRLKCVTVWETDKTSCTYPA